MWGYEILKKIVLVWGREGVHMIQETQGEPKQKLDGSVFFLIFFWGRGGGILCDDMK